MSSEDWSGVKNLHHSTWYCNCCHGGESNVYVGNVDFETFSEEKLRQDFSEYGDIELEYIERKVLRVR